MGCVKENEVRICEERNVGSCLNAGFVETELDKTGERYTGGKLSIQLKKLTFPDSLLGPSQAECSLQNTWVLE